MPLLAAKETNGSSLIRYIHICISPYCSRNVNLDQGRLVAILAQRLLKICDDFHQPAVGLPSQET